MTDDAQLLRQYAHSRSEAAFAELVQRHLAMVYHSAARQLEDDSHLAQDVAQSVFVLLARKSRLLLGHPSLAAWLHTTTHFKCSEIARGERRRRAREATAHFMHELIQNEMSAADWERLRPMIDELLLELKESDRELVLLRFFEERSFAEIAARLRLKENSAHKRVERALENLRKRLDRRGVKSTATALATAITGHAALGAPPAGLAASVTGAVMSSGLPAVMTWSALSFMSTKITATAAAVVLVVAGGVATHQMNAERDASAALTLITHENAALAARVRAEEALRARVATAPQPPPVRPNTGASAQTSAVARALGTGGLATVEESRAFLRANPEVREALARYHHDTLRATYSELIAKLGLSDGERDRLLAILALGNRRIVGEHQLSLADADVSGAEITQQLRELLGEARYEQYREYRASSALRDVTQEMVRMLYFTSAPLTPTHAAELKQIVSRALADPALGPKTGGGVWPYIPKPVWEQVIANARTRLPEPQVEALRELQQRSQFFHAQAEASKAYRAAQPTNKQPGK